MEISDRRYKELIESMGFQRRERDRVLSSAGATLATRPERERTTRMEARQSTIQFEPKQVQRPQILLVDPDRNGLLAVQAALRLVADVETCSDFRAARTRLFIQPPDLLVTNLRLQANNGLHLVYLAAGTHTRCIVYAPHDDLILAREAQAAGAFYERLLRLPQALPSYVNATLPDHDRRDLTVLDRRLKFRGGRRCTDLQLSQTKSGIL